MSKNLNNIEIYDDCSMCCACFNICPVEAIEILKTGIYYSLKVDNEKCIHCGKCIAICPVNNEIRPNVQTLHSYAAFSADPKVVMGSSSGGVFHELASYVLKNGGVVWGAGFSDDYKEVLITSTEDIDLESLQKSKYVESLVGNSFKRIKTELEKGKTVLFCGSPCQVAGLKVYLGKEYDNLVTCDFTCGGFPSHRMYKEHIESLERRYKAKVTSVDFRPKKYGWKIHTIFMLFGNGKQYVKSALFDSFFYQFIHTKNNIRDYCYKCRFSDNHFSDLILADLWKQPTDSDAKVNQSGTSLVVTNTEKGEEILSEIRKRLELSALTETDGLYNLKTTSYPESKANEHVAFIKDYESLGEKGAHKRHDKTSIIQKGKHAINIFLKYRNGRMS